VSPEVVDSLRYTADHCWARTDTDGSVTVGVTDFAQEALGAIVFVGLPEVGRVVQADETFGEVESTKAVSELYAPISGTISAVNEALEDAPGEVNTDPYGTGWICAIRPVDPDAISRLLDADGYGRLTDVAARVEPSTSD
jgi:glycine cleavage system H protein